MGYPTIQIVFKDLDGWVLFIYRSNNMKGSDLGVVLVSSEGLQFNIAYD